MTTGCNINKVNNTKTASSSSDEAISKAANSDSSETTKSQHSRSNEKAVNIDDDNATETTSEPKNTDSNKAKPIGDNDLQFCDYKLNMTLEEFEKVMPNDLKEKILSVIQLPNL